MKRPSARRTTPAKLNLNQTSVMNSNKQLRCLQINLQHNSTASAYFAQLIFELELDIIFVQEPFLLSSTRKFPCLPPGYTIHHSPTDDHACESAIISKQVHKVEHLRTTSPNEIVGVELHCKSQKLLCFSIYKRPSTDNLVQILENLVRMNQRVDSYIICIDANAHNNIWNSNFTDENGRELEYFIIGNNLNICNVGKQYLAYYPRNTTFVDVTLMGNRIATKMTDWRFLSTPSLSDHPYIYFSKDEHQIKKNYKERPLPKLSRTDT